MDTHFIDCISKTEIQPHIELMGYGRKKKKKEWVPSDCHCNRYGECDCSNCYVCDECFVPDACQCNRYGECDCSPTAWFAQIAAIAIAIATAIVIVIAIANGG